MTHESEQPSSREGATEPPDGHAFVPDQFPDTSALMGPRVFGYELAARLRNELRHVENPSTRPQAQVRIASTCAYIAGFLRGLGAVGPLPSPEQMPAADTSEAKALDRDVSILIEALEAIPAAAPRQLWWLATDIFTRCGRPKYEDGKS